MLGASTTQAGGSTTPDLIAAGTSSFNVLDKNKNGHVEVSEFLISFDKSDTNHDNEMSIQEYVQFRHATKTFTQALYKFLDTDHDGSVSRAEMIRLFRLYDDNNDGVITLPEFISRYLKVTSHQQPPPESCCEQMGSYFRINQDPVRNKAFY